VIVLINRILLIHITSLLVSQSMKKRNTAREGVALPFPLYIYI